MPSDCTDKTETIHMHMQLIKLHLYSNLITYLIKICFLFLLITEQSALLVLHNHNYIITTVIVIQFIKMSESVISIK